MAFGNFYSISYYDIPVYLKYAEFEAAWSCFREEKRRLWTSCGHRITILQPIFCWIALMDV